MLQRFPLAVEYRAAILIGFLGAYTTFSTFALETLYLFEEGSLLKAGLNVLLSVFLCLAAVWVGLILGRQLFTGDAYPWLGHGFLYRYLGLGLLAAFLLTALAFTLPEIRFEFQGLLSLFVINALFGVAAVWLGLLMGNWLWQLNLSRSGVSICTKANINRTRS